MAFSCDAFCGNCIYAGGYILYSWKSGDTLECERRAEWICGKMDFVGPSAAGVFIDVYSYKPFYETAWKQPSEQGDGLCVFSGAGYALDSDGRRSCSLSFLSIGNGSKCCFDCCHRKLCPFPGYCLYPGET